MKVSVSLSEDDITFLDKYAREHGYRSRSAALQHAVAILRAGQLASAYEDAWRSWSVSGDAELWDSTSADGLDFEPARGSVARVYPFQVLLTSTTTGLSRDSKAQAEQVRSIAVERVGRLRGTLTAEQMHQLDNALRLHLSL